MRKKKRKIKEIKNVFIFGVCAAVSGAATMLGINALPVMATEDVGGRGDYRRKYGGWYCRKIV